MPGARQAKQARSTAGRLEYGLHAQKIPRPTEPPKAYWLGPPGEIACALASRPTF